MSPDWPPCYSLHGPATTCPVKSAAVAVGMCAVSAVACGASDGDVEQPQPLCVRPSLRPAACRLMWHRCRTSGAASWTLGWSSCRAAPGAAGSCCSCTSAAQRSCGTRCTGLGPRESATALNCMHALLLLLPRMCVGVLVPARQPKITTQLPGLQPLSAMPLPPLAPQVRCMAAVLLMVGRGEEQPEVVQTLLDTQRCPRKPQFNMASGGLASASENMASGGLAGVATSVTNTARSAGAWGACKYRLHWVGACLARGATTRTAPYHTFPCLIHRSPLLLPASFLLSLLLQRSRCCCTAAQVVCFTHLDLPILLAPLRCCCRGAAAAVQLRLWRPAVQAQRGQLWAGALAAGGHAHQVCCFGFTVCVED